MACGDEKKRNSFTLIWKVENSNYWWKKGTYIESPTFRVEEIEGTEWKLQLYFPFNNKHNESSLYLKRQAGNKNAVFVVIDFQLAFLSPDGNVLDSFDRKNSVFYEYGTIGSDEFPSRDEVFFQRRSEFLLQNTLTARCCLWKSVDEFSKYFHWQARTRIVVEKRSSLWNIENFSTFQSNDKRTHDILSLGDSEQLISLELLPTGGLISGETLHLKVIPNYQTIKTSTLQVSIIDASKHPAKCFLGEFCIEDPYNNKEFTLPYTKRELMGKKVVYLPNDVLSLMCECSVCFGNILEEIESVSSSCSAIEQDESCFFKANASIPKGILIDDFKSLLNNDRHSDVKVKTRSKMYSAHKFILGVRSPVFKVMFSTDMKEKNTDCVVIDDLSDETVWHMLQYIYSAEVEELDWDDATELYGAADKYEVLNLKDICSSYLKNNLCNENACEALVLADLYQDENLKRFVQDYILRHAKVVINSEEWDLLMESNVKIAAETMHLKFRELAS